MRKQIRALPLLIVLGLAGVTFADDAPQPATSIELPGCENVFRAGEKILSGGEPHSEEAFQSMANAGVKTIISVDGANPNLELAQKYGMRYVHLPIAYDTIEPQRALELGRALRDLEGPIYMHCHHGKHRGPAAAAIALIAAEGWTNEKAVAFLRQAGTSEKYEGLYTVVQSFSLNSPGELDTAPADFPQVADRSDMVQAMANMDRRFDNLALAAAEEFRVPKDHPDIDPKHEALQLYETFRELIRANTHSDWSEDMTQWMREGEALSQRLEQTLRTGAPGADELMVGLRKNCSTCHDAYRNTK